MMPTLRPQRIALAHRLQHSCLARTVLSERLWTPTPQTSKTTEGLKIGRPVGQLKSLCQLSLRQLSRLRASSPSVVHDLNTNPQPAKAEEW